MMRATVEQSPVEAHAAAVKVKSAVDIASVAGAIGGIGTICLGFLLEGGHLDALVNLPGFLIVFGGTMGAVLLSCPHYLVLRLPRLIMLAFLPKSIDELASIELLAGLADTARREGLLSLERTIDTIEYGFLRRGIQIVVDGAEPETVREVLDVEVEQMHERHAAGYGVLEAMGGFAPTMGILGAVIGLVHVLGSLDDPSELGPKIAVAFIATLYGVASANLLWLPLASKLKSQSNREALLRRMMIDGLLAIQAGENPRVIKERLLGFLPPNKRGAQGARRSEGTDEQRG